MQQPYSRAGTLIAIQAGAKPPADQPSGEHDLFDTLKNAPVLIVVADQQGRIRSANQAFKVVVGWHPETIVGRRLLDALGAAQATCVFAEQFRSAFAARFRPPLTAVSPLVTASGDRRQIRWAFLAAPPPVGRGLAAVNDILAIGIDVTECLAGESVARRRHADLLRHMYDGMLTAFATTLSHEVSQPLSAVLAYLQGSVRLFAQGAVAWHEIAAYLDKAALQATCAAKLTRAMRYRKQNEVPAAALVDVNSVVAGVVAVAEADFLAHGITVHVDLARGLPAVSMNSRALELTLFTLIQTILGAVVKTKADSGVLSLASGRSDTRGVDIALSLNGIGGTCPPTSRAFIGGGLDTIALGFSMCRSVLRDHDGELDLRDTACGITFVVSLPKVIEEGAND